jgi:aspartate 1-decarboxylase
MLRLQLKSKIHLACLTDADLDYEGSITVPRDVMQAVDLWPGEKVLVVDRDNGERLETYVQPGPAGSGRFVMNGAAARRVHVGDRITLMAFGQSEKPISAKKVLLNERNEIVRAVEGVENPVVLPAGFPFESEAPGRRDARRAAPESL